MSGEKSSHLVLVSDITCGNPDDRHMHITPAGPVLHDPTTSEPVGVRVMCINWSSPRAPHAVALLVNSAGDTIADVFFPTWREAQDWAADVAERIKVRARCRARRRVEGGRHA